MAVSVCCKKTEWIAYFTSCFCLLHPPSPKQVSGESPAALFMCERQTPEKVPKTQFCEVHIWKQLYSHFTVFGSVNIPQWEGHHVQLMFQLLRIMKMVLKTIDFCLWQDTAREWPQSFVYEVLFPAGHPSWNIGFIGLNSHVGQSGVWVLLIAVMVDLHLVPARLSDVVEPPFDAPTVEIEHHEKHHPNQSQH